MPEPILSRHEPESVSAAREATHAITKQYDRAYWTRCVEEYKQPMELLGALGDSGLLGLGVAEEHGGQGGGLHEQVALIEELGRAGIPGYSFLVANFVRHTLLRVGSDEQIAAHVPMTLTGETFTSFALTEQDAGTNSFAIRTRARRDGSEWIVDGQKCFITAAGEASQMMLVARTDAGGSAKPALSVFVFALPAAGVTFKRQRIDAAAPDHQYLVMLDQVRLPEGALVGEEGRGTEYLFQALNSERLLGSAMALGLGDFALSKGVDYANQRAPFGRPIASYQAVAHPLARARVQLDAARALLYQTVVDVGTPAESNYAASACKLVASEAANAALDATIQVHGGWAFDRDLDVITLSEVMRLMRIAPINNESVLNLVASSRLGLARS